MDSDANTRSGGSSGTGDRLSYPQNEVPAWARPPGDGRPPIRTIGPQRGRLLPAHRVALDELSDRFLVSPAEAAARRPAILDVAMGDGATTVALAAAAPDVLHVAVDVHRPGIAQLLRRLDADDLDNVLVVEADVWDLLFLLEPASLSAVQCCFPDPWPKARHHRRRLVGAPFVTRCADVLADGGELRLATDWPHYADQMRSVVRSCSSLSFVSGAGGWSPRFAGRPLTTYERRGLAAGRPPRDIRASRLARS